MDSRRRNTLLVALGMAAFLVAVAILVFLMVKTRAGDPRLRTEIIFDLRELREIDGQLDIDLLRSRNNLHNDYDPLTSPLTRLGLVEERLRADLERAGYPPATADDLMGYFSKKLDVIESFKADNSILRNSLRYVPTVAGELDALAREAVLDRKSRQRCEALVLQVRAVVGDLFHHIALGESANGERIAAGVEASVRLAATLSPEIQAAVDGFALHIRTIMEQRDREAELLARLPHLSAAGKINGVQQGVEQLFVSRNEEQETFRAYLVAYAVVLLLMVVYFAIRLVQSFRLIARKNAQLRDANDHLELRVEQRTRELNTALANLKAQEMQLIQSEKMASLGQMVAGVAHEINTPLGYVRGSVELLGSMLEQTIAPYCASSRQLLGRLDPGTDGADGARALPRQAIDAADQVRPEIFRELQEVVKNCLYGIDQIGEMVTNLKDFSRIDRGRVTMHRIEDSVESTLLLAKQQVTHRKIVKNYGKDTVPVPCAPSQINQVLLNLITNAVQATTEETGVITITTRMRDPDHLMVEVEDNGSGIAPDVLGKIFDPFFTTKDVGRGTGLGLSIVYKIVEQHRGKIEVASRVGVGTRFVITLPIAAESAR